MKCWHCLQKTECRSKARQSSRCSRRQIHWGPCCPGRGEESRADVRGEEDFRQAEGRRGQVLRGNKVSKRKWAGWSVTVMLRQPVMSNSFWPHGLQPTRLLCPWGFSRQEYWSGWPCPPPGDLPNPGTEPRPPVSPELAGRFLTTEPPGKLYRRASRPQKAKRKSWTPCKDLWRILNRRNWTKVLT